MRLATNRPPGICPDSTKAPETTPTVPLPHPRDLVMENPQHVRSAHGHHKVAAAVFVGSLIVGSAMILSAELMKPERYEFHAGPSATNYVIYDRDTGRAGTVEYSAKNPKASLGE